jgi:isoquinoline 1-oxidoreductase alpha subunit
VLVDGESVTSCRAKVGDMVGRKILTIEGLGKPGLHRIQKAWIEHEVPQCGYCQPGMIMSAACSRRARADGRRRRCDDELVSCGTMPACAGHPCRRVARGCVTPAKA